MTAERLSVTKKCCLNCKEFPTYGSVCSPFDVDQAAFSCSDHLFDREDLLRRATAIEAENAELRTQLEARQRSLSKIFEDLHAVVSCAAMNHWEGDLMKDAWTSIEALRSIAGRE